MNKKIEQLPSLGFIGLGDMGLHMTMNLLAAGYSVRGFDLKEEKLTACTNAGGTAASSIKEIVGNSDIVMMSLPSSEAFIHVAEKELIPLAEAGQIFIEFGTTIPYEIKRLAKLFEEKGAHLLDIPVSGGMVGAEKAKLKVWVGGEKEIFEKCLPILEVIGGPSNIDYCGPNGFGQAMKGVNQLYMGVINAAYLEILAFGIRSGLDPELICKVFPDERGQSLAGIARKIMQGDGNEVGVKFRELPYYIRESEHQGYDLPMTRVLYDFCDKGERVVIDDHRSAPSFWNELNKKGEGK